LLAEHERRVGELDHPARVVEVEVRHHDQLHRGGLDPARAELVGQRLLGLHLPRARDGRGKELADVLLLVHGHRRVQAGVDQDRAGARVLDEERDDRELGGLPAAHAHRLERGEAPLLAVAVGLRPAAGAAQQRMDPDRGVRLAAGQRELGGRGVGCGCHGRAAG
jgi:hypothetical protein